MPWFFDVLIFGFLALDLAGILILIRKGETILPKGLNTVLIVMAIVAFAVIAYGSFIEPRRLLVHSEIITLTDDSTRVLHAVLISDIHVGPYKGTAYVQQIVDTINEINPDIVLLAGDFVENDADQAIDLAPLGHISKVYPTYAVLGNHDYQLGGDSDPTDEETAAGVTARLSTLGVRVLNNEGVKLNNGGVWLAGVDEIWADNANVTTSLLGRPTDETPTILLVHNPDIITSLTPAEQIDLVLAG